MAAGYEFTTLTAIPGTMHYRGAKIQVLDLPGIIEGAKDGKGRGRQVHIVFFPYFKKLKMIQNSILFAGFSCSIDLQCHLDRT